MCSSTGVRISLQNLVFVGWADLQVHAIRFISTKAVFFLRGGVGTYRFNRWFQGLMLWIHLMVRGIGIYVRTYM